MDLVKKQGMDLPGGSVVRNWPTNAGDTSLIPESGGVHIHGAAGPLHHNY